MKVRNTANRPKGLRVEWIRVWDGSWIPVGRIRAASRKFFIYRPEGCKSVCLTHRNSGYKAFGVRCCKQG